MNIRDYIDLQTRNSNKDQKLGSKPKFEKVKQEKPKQSPRYKGEKPTMLDTSRSSSTDSKKSSKQRRDKPSFDDIVCQTDNSNQGNQTVGSRNVVKDYTFPGIIPSVRETTGGWNVQSNEAIERRFKENQKRLREKENSSTGSAISGDATDTTFSSETTDSYKTAIQDSFQLRSDQQTKSSKVKNVDQLERYKKNVLMKGLLQDAAKNHQDKDETSTDSSSNFQDAPSFTSDIQNGMQNLNFETDENSMRQERIFRLFQSTEDEDVYVHPLREQIKNDPEWRKHRLERKGIETIQTSRDYYMNLDDDGFSFS